MNQTIKTRAADTAFATGAFAQSTVVPIDNEPSPRLVVEPPLPTCRAGQHKVLIELRRCRLHCGGLRPAGQGSDQGRELSVAKSP